MYDLDWAQRVYVDFCKVRTRTNNIDNCLIQRILETHYRHLSRLDVQICLIESIASPKKQELWKLYKLLVKKEPFDKALLDRTTNALGCMYLDRKDRTEQLLLF